MAQPGGRGGRGDRLAQGELRLAADDRGPRPVARGGLLPPGHGGGCARPREPLVLRGAAEALSEHALDRETAYAFLDANFRDEGEWLHRDIYVFVLTTEGINFFQAPDRDWEGTDTSELEDLNGVKLFEELLAAGRAGGGFVEYQWDNPAVEGDEEDGSPKLAYAVPVTVGGVPMLLGSGIYPDASAR